MRMVSLLGVGRVKLMSGGMVSLAQCMVVELMLLRESLAYTVMLCVPSDRLLRTVWKAEIDPNVVFVPLESSSYADQLTVSPKVTLKVSEFVVVLRGRLMVIEGGVLSIVMVLLSAHTV